MYNIDFNSKGKIYTNQRDRNNKKIYDGDDVKIIFTDEVPYGQPTIGTVNWGSYSDDEYVSNVECWMVCGIPLSDKGGLFGISSHEYELVEKMTDNIKTIYRINRSRDVLEILSIKVFNDRYPLYDVNILLDGEFHRIENCNYIAEIGE